MIYKKLSNIQKKSRQNFLKSIKPAFQFKKSFKEAYVKNGIKLLAQQNLFMLKKLITQKSDYKADKFEQEYQESRIYKNNICRFPSINFNKTRNTQFSSIQNYDLKTQKKVKIFNTEGNLPTINTNKKRINLFQTKYANTNRDLDSHYFKEALRKVKTKNCNNKKKIEKKIEIKSMNSVSENDNDSSSSNNKSNVNNDKKIDKEKKSGSENVEEKNNDSGFGPSD